ncbi:hypothetical protein [Succinispira mobilis]|uniref:hypothetical protein n=1 Tax=Succinispira mobilis TaxID=78120 RepID=UPI000377D151|nr:hypothetical protein [Succinispira mobilis]
MLRYLIGFGTLVMLFLVLIQVIPKRWLIIWSFIVVFHEFFKVFFDNLDKKYYHEKKYMWNFILGMLMLIISIIAFALSYFNYIEFELYHIAMLIFGATLTIYGRRKLVYLKMQDDKSSKDLIEEYKRLSSSLKKAYFTLTLFLAICVYIIFLYLS